MTNDLEVFLARADRALARCAAEFGSISLEVARANRDDRVLRLSELAERLGLSDHVAASPSSCTAILEMKALGDAPRFGFSANASR